MVHHNILFLQEYCDSLDSTPPSSPPPEPPEGGQEVKQEATKKEKSAGDPVAVPTVSTDISAVEDILQLLKVLYSISTTSAFDFGEGGKKGHFFFFFLNKVSFFFQRRAPIIIPN